MTRKLVALAMASVFVLGLAACSDDDDGGSFGLPAGQGTTQPGGVPGGAADANTGGAEAGGYTQPMHDDFVNECTGQPGATGDMCECAWNTITQSVPFEDYQAFETGFAQGDTTFPEWLTSAVTSCA
jgi:hypothetical protein